jgi:hypothetical protein
VLVIAELGELRVERDPRRVSGRLLRDGGLEASYIDLADPRHLEFDYLRWMRLVLRSARARRVLHLGGGACALARALAAEDPGSRQEVCEIDPDVLRLARAHMGLRRRPGLRVRGVDGRAFLDRAGAQRRTGSGVGRAWDAIVLDAFVGARVPESLSSAEAMAAAARVAPLVLVNVAAGAGAGTDPEVQRITRSITSCFAWSAAIRGRGGNTVLLGARLDGDRDRVRCRVGLDRLIAGLARDPSPARLVEAAAGEGR